MVHLPFPKTGVFPFRPTLELQKFISAPALAVDIALKVMLTSSTLVAQLPEIAHLKTYEDPGLPVNVEVLLEALPNEPPVPLRTLQLPVPTDGWLAASVTVVNPQVDAPV